MKKILALLESLTLAFSVCTFTTITASAETKYYEEKVFIADDFENYGTGAMSSFKGQAGATITAACELTLSGEDFTKHTVRAFLIYENAVYPVTSSISAF